MSDRAGSVLVIEVEYFEKEVKKKDVKAAIQKAFDYCILLRNHESNPIHDNIFYAAVIGIGSDIYYKGKAPGKGNAFPIPCIEKFDT